MSPLISRLRTVTLTVALGSSVAFVNALAPKALAATQLKSEQDKISYMIGYQIGSNFKRDGIEVDLNMLQSGLKEAMAGEKSPLTDEESKTLMKNLQTSLQAKAESKRKADGQKNGDEGKKFLVENGKKSGVKTTASGLQYKVINEGKGDAPKATDTVKVNYAGKLLNGTEFDSSYKRKQPATFPVKGVIPGWTEALQLMKPGSKYELWIPAELAYGERGAGNDIGPNSTLNFEVELLSIEKPTAANTPTAPKTEEKKK